MKPSTPKLLAGAFILAIATMLATIAIAGAPSEPAREVVQSWNAAVGTIEAEDRNFHELLDSYRLNPPGRVLLTTDVRASQKRRRLKLIDDIVRSHQQRIADLQSLARAESSLP